MRSLQRLDRPLYLAGYGQGGALAMDVALSDASKIKPVNGVAVFSSYFITHENFSHDALVETPVFWAHSQRDTKIPFSMAKYGYEVKRKRKILSFLCWKTYLVSFVCLETIGRNLAMCPFSVFDF